MNFSYWERQFISVKADIVIIGGGITGLSAAYHAKKKNSRWHVIVVEQYSRSNAASTRNAGFSCFGSAGELADDLARGASENEVFSTVQKRFNGLQLLRKTLGEKALEYESCGGTELFDPSQGDEFHLVSDQLAHFNSLLKDITQSENTYNIRAVPDELNGYSSAIENKLEGKLNPGKMMMAWQKLCSENGVEIIHGSRAELADNHRGIYLNNHFIQSNQIIICTNGLTNKLNLSLPVKPARNLVLLTEPIPDLNLPSTYHHMKGYMYFRKIHDRLLLGGGRHKFKSEEFTSEFEVNQQVKTYLMEYLKDHMDISENQIEQEWTGIMGVEDSKETLVKRIDEHLVCGVRLGGMGVAIGTMIGKETIELID